MLLRWKHAFMWALFIFCGLTVAVQAQSFDEGLELYQRHKYEQAAEIFSQLNTQKADLFAGKAYLSAGKYKQATSSLQKVQKSDNPDLFWESQYTTALLNFQLGDYSTALNNLFQLKKTNANIDFIQASKTFYHQVLNYLTFEQRRGVLKKTSYEQLQYDLVHSALGKISYEDAKTLWTDLQSATNISNAHRKQFSSVLSDSVRYANVADTSKGLQAPEGMTYNIGVALPSFSQNNRNFDVTQGLYYGYLLASERFNKAHDGKRIILHYQNTGVKIDSSQHIIQNLRRNYHGSVVLGPLFSRSLRSMAPEAARYHVPLIAPLANSDTMGIDNQFIYRTNPSFVVHGKKMAKYAVDSLNMHRFVVMAERNSLGEGSAFAFRQQVEKMGGEIAYFFDENFKSTGFSLSPYMQQISSNTTAPVDAIYAPFTGETGSSLIRLLIGNLQSRKDTLSILGSQQWGDMEIPVDQLHGQDIYYTKSYSKRGQSANVSFFRRNFKERFSMSPNRFAMIGYDVARFLFETINRIQNPALLDEKLSTQPVYHGIICDIKFNNSGINQMLNVFKIRREAADALYQKQ